MLRQRSFSSIRYTPLFERAFRDAIDYCRTTCNKIKKSHPEITLVEIPIMTPRQLSTCIKKLYLSLQSLGPVVLPEVISSNGLVFIVSTKTGVSGLDVIDEYMCYC